MPSAQDITAASLKVGMEVHVELATRTRMWTSVPNLAHPDYHDVEPNTLLDPVTIGMPGTLPVANKAAVEMSIRVGLALNCKIASRTKWDRKSYWYPDLPKNYQISQYDMPLCFDGSIELTADHAIAAGITLTDKHDDLFPCHINIIRAHLEEDAGKLLHEAPGGLPIDDSIVDLNRAGTPLLEIVTQPDFRHPDQALAFANTLRDLCRHLGVTQGIMQKGHIRFEPNINVMLDTKDGKTHATPIVEIKNLNSFRALHGSITHEYQRQIDQWCETGKTLSAGSKQTRGWDDAKLVTTLQREKEDAHDYRYFPDPDLVTITISDDWLEQIKASQPETPNDKRRRYRDDLGLADAQVEQLLTDIGSSAMFDAAVTAGADPRKTASFILNAVAKLANERTLDIGQLPIAPEQLAGIVTLQNDGKISSNAAEQLLALCCDSDELPEALAEKNNLLQVTDTSALDGYIDQVINDPKMAKAVEDIKAGKDKAIGALVGQIMKLSKGQANPQALRPMILEKLGR